jgi:multidrug efflux pump subunit AcrA (membrane-fusion protein)
MKKLMMIIMVALAAAGMVFVPSLLAGLNGPSPGGRPDPGSGGAGAEGAVFTVRTGDAVIRSLEAYIEVNGNIVNEEQVTVVPDAAGKLVSMNAALGDTVRQGDLIAQVDPPAPARGIH